MGFCLWKLFFHGSRDEARLSGQNWGSWGPYRGFTFAFLCNGGGERAEEDLVGRTVFVERRTDF